MRTLPADDPLAVAVVSAIRGGDQIQLAKLLDDNPGLAAVAIGDACSARTLLHIATDWPGHFPGVASTIATLVRAGTDVNSRFVGPHVETPLHWAASSDDVRALDALLDAGADIDAGGAVIGGGSALADATAFGQWNAARRLVERGAAVTFWEAAALGLLDRLRAALSAETPPVSRSEITEAFWGACHAGQLAAAQLLLDSGADPVWIGWDDLTPLEAAARADAKAVVEWLGSYLADRQ